MGAASCNIALIQDAKLLTSFYTVRCKKGHNPNLIFVSESFANTFDKSIMQLTYTYKVYHHINEMASIIGSIA